MRARVVLASIVALAACGGSPSPRPSSPAEPSHAELAARGVALDTRIAEALRLLCFVEPTHRHDNGLPLAEPCPGAHELDRGARSGLEERMAGGIVDPLALDLRAALLGDARAGLEASARDPFAVARSDGSRRDHDLAVTRARLAAAAAHVEMDRDFARSASRWLETARLAWPVDDESRAVTRARALILAKVATHASELGVTEARAAEDAAEALEAAGLARGDGAGAVARLQAVLEGVSAASTLAPPPRLRQWLEATTGEAMDGERHRRALERVLALTHDAAERALAPLSGAAREEASEAAARLVVAPPPCRPAGRADGAPFLAPPRERRAMCALSRAVREPGDAARAVALVATHDSAVLALRAWDASEPERARAHHAAIALVGPVWSARAERFVASEPLTALGGGFAAVVLTARGLEQLEAVARAYDVAGDAPFPIGAPRWMSPAP